MNGMLHTESVESSESADLKPRRTLNSYQNEQPGNKGSCYPY